jgi:hypothetical protein
MKIPDRLEPHRITTGHNGSSPGWSCGAFDLPGPCGERLVIIADDGRDPDPLLGGWKHVSVSTRRRNPNWQEMCWVKDLFWDPEDCVVQYHPPRSVYVSHHPYCLHLWRPLRERLPMPSHLLVGPKAG